MPLLLAIAIVLLLAAPASASPTQESTLQDDERLLYSPPDRVRATLDELRDLGVDRLRLTLVWKGIAPAPASRARPAGFDASDPAAYPAGTWDKFELVTTEARARGMDVSFNLTAPAPLWATAVPPREDVAETFEPSPAEFGAFVTAVGRRFPTVRHFSIWNEPNQSGWLTPQFADAGGGRFVEAAPRIYRALADAAYGALAATGHGGDTILVGETAPKGDASRGVKRRMKPLVFVRALYCVDERLRPLAGSRAADLGCTESRADFVANHPALFRPSGFSHHPYELLLAPSTRQRDPDFVTIGQVTRLTATLDTVFRAYGVARRLPLHLTEYGYQTDPPDELNGVALARQAAYLNESEYLAWRQPRVRTLAQFLLSDDDGDVGATFQSGLRFLGGSAKPALAAYRLPVWVAQPTVRRGRTLKVWAMLRGTASGTARIEVRAGASGPWRPSRTVTTRSPRGYLTASVRVRRSGAMRIRSGDVTSRAVAVRVRRR